MEGEALKTNEEYWTRVRARAKALGSDGCSGVPDWHVDCCYEHDVHWRTGMTMAGEHIGADDATKRFEQCIQQRSQFRQFSPMAWWRWAGVRLWNRWKR